MHKLTPQKSLPATHPTAHPVRVATWNIHKGVNGLGPRKRLEIHNIGLAIDQFDADIVCLQEVRKLNRGEARRFAHWPEQEQADFLAPLGYSAVYQTNAVTKHGEHGNALLTRWPIIRHQHEDMSDHRFEQRGLLHVEVLVHELPIHIIVVHLGLIKASRGRQIEQLTTFIGREIPTDAPLLIAGDFNDWGSASMSRLHTLELKIFDAIRHAGKSLRTFPARLPIVQLDYICARNLVPTDAQVPRGQAWARMSDHLPLITDFSIQKTLHAGEDSVADSASSSG
jgi:endonuclease/exonuclease/phosphatase family metal-dependent hydrolase